MLFWKIHILLYCYLHLWAIYTGPRASFLLYTRPSRILHVTYLDPCFTFQLCSSPFDGVERKQMALLVRYIPRAFSIVFHQREFHQPQFYCYQLKLGFEIVTGTYDVTAKWYLDRESINSLL